MSNDKDDCVFPEYHTYIPKVTEKNESVNVPSYNDYQEYFLKLNNETLADENMFYNVSLKHDYNLDIDNRVIYLNSESYSEESANGETGVDFMMSKRFMKNLDQLNSISHEPILVKTLNCGGCWFYGMAIYDAIKRSPSPVDIEASAWARSMSSIILQAGRKRLLSSSAAFMVHYGEYSDFGDFRKVKSGMDFYEITNKRMFSIYASRCISSPIWSGKSPEEISKLLEDTVKEKTDWWMDAYEAVYYGFADEVV